ncbi:MAG: hypothetical protein JWP45_1610 [Mucilaginibacter sp.]|nr:hypothetical protein [Mucilaginibacter sp.]
MVNRLLLTIFFSLGLLFSYNLLCAQSVTFADYGFSKPIILNTSQITGGITSTLIDFPALVYIKDDALKTGLACGDKVQFPTGNGGGLTVGTNYDFAFLLNGSSTELNYQVDTYDPINGILFAWVRIPSLTSTNASITFYFGSKNPAHSAATAAATWASNYKAVYHFNEASTTATVLDATGNGRNAIQANTTVTNDEIHLAASVPIPGGGYSFNGSSTSIIQNAGSNPDITGPFTISAWVYYNGTSSSDNKIVSDEYNFGHGYKLSVKAGSLETETRTTANPTPGNLLHVGTVTGSTWQYIQGEYDGTKFINFINGVQVTTSTVTGAAPEIGNVLSMGLDHGSSGVYPDQNFYNGYMDEVRISNVAKSADWIRAEYYNQTKPLLFTNYSGSITTYEPNASALVGAATYTWKGTTSTDANLASNWDVSPTSFTNGYASWAIPLCANNPKLTANASIYELTIADGAKLDLNGFTLSVGCNIYNNATTSGTGIQNSSTNASGITWDGSVLSAQTYTGTNNSNTAEVGNMICNNSLGGTVTITGGPVDLFNLLTITKGNLVVNNAGNGALTLKSTSTQSATVTAIPTTSSITGNVNVERYISGGTNTYRGYRFLSSAIYTARSGSNYYYDLSYLPNFAPVTGSLASGGVTKTGNPTIYLYRDDEAFTNKTFNTGNFRGVNKINNNPLYQIGVDYDGTFALHAGTGFLFFYRGNLTNISTKYLSTTVAEANVFVSTGILNQQAVTVTNWVTGLTTLQYSTVPGNTGYSGYNLVGNPYASSIDWNTISATNAAAGIYGPGVGTSTYIFNDAAKVYAIYNYNAGVGVGSNGASNIIPSGQGFFVKATVATAQLIFNEAAKTNAQLTGPTSSSSTGSTLLLSASPVTDNTIQYLRLNLAADTINKEETIVCFEKGASDNYVENEDSGYMTGMGLVSLSSMSADNIQTGINAIPFPKKSKTVKLKVTTTASGLFSLNMTEIKNVPELFEVWLMDAYKKDSLDIRHNSTYKFNVSLGDTSSFGLNRFSLVIRQNKALGVHLLNFTALKAAHGAQIEWKVENEQNYTTFTVERSVDNGITFNELGTLTSGGTGDYNFIDTNPLPVADKYRLKIVDLNGTVTYSSIVTLMYGNASKDAASNISVYPNPAKGALNLTIVPAASSNSNPDLSLSSVTPSSSAVSNTVYDIKIINNTGAVIKTATTSQAGWQTDVSSLLPGTYFIQVTNSNNKTTVGKSTFIKL